MLRLLHFPFYLFPLLVLLTACAPGGDQGPDDRYADEIVTRKDRNKDNVYDYERHHIPNGGDADWELVDTNFDGVYDQKIRYGFTIKYEQVNIPAPKS